MLTRAYLRPVLSLHAWHWTPVRHRGVASSIDRAALRLPAFLDRFPPLPNTIGEEEEHDALESDRRTLQLTSTSLVPTLRWVTDPVVTASALFCAAHYRLVRREDAAWLCFIARHVYGSEHPPPGAIHMLGMCVAALRTLFDSDPSSTPSELNHFFSCVLGLKGIDTADHPQRGEFYRDHFMTLLYHAGSTSTLLRYVSDSPKFFLAITRELSLPGFGTSCFARTSTDDVVDDRVAYLPRATRQARVVNALRLVHHAAEQIQGTKDEFEFAELFSGWRPVYGRTFYYSSAPLPHILELVRAWDPRDEAHRALGEALLDLALTVGLKMPRQLELAEGVVPRLLELSHRWPLPEHVASTVPPSVHERAVRFLKTLLRGRDENGSMTILDSETKKLLSKFEVPFWSAFKASNN